MRAVCGGRDARPPAGSAWEALPVRRTRPHRRGAGPNTTAFKSTPLGPLGISKPGGFRENPCTPSPFSATPAPPNGQSKDHFLYFLSDHVDYAFHNPLCRRRLHTTASLSRSVCGDTHPLSRPTRANVVSKSLFPTAPAPQDGMSVRTSLRAKSINFRDPSRENGTAQSLCCHHLGTLCKAADQTRLDCG